MDCVRFRCCIACRNRLISNDSRKVKEGSVFVCIAGAVADGHEYIEDVAAKGAAAVIVERPVNAPEGLTVIHVDDTRYALALMSAAYFGYPAKKLNVIGITGTKGKTTTTYMVKSILEGVGHHFPDRLRIPDALINWSVSSSYTSI